MADIHNNPKYKGVLTVLDPGSKSERPAAGKIQDDIEGKQEIIPDFELAPTSSSISELMKTLADASKGVSEKTDGEYHRLIIQCEEFLITEKLSQKGKFFGSLLPANAAHYIVAWIMHECDEIMLDGSKKPSSQQRASFGHAQKMRAAMTYAFGRIHGLGNLQWHKDTISGNMVGNPSVSETVSYYMLSLHRRKVRAGETPTSARAITAAILSKLYDQNHQSPNWEIKPYSGPRSKHQREVDKQAGIWGGPYSLRLLQLAYTLAFTCLFRVDEVLKIQSHDIRLTDGINSKTLTVTLPFRKTSQFGEIQPFVLHEMPSQMAHLCPVRAYAEWVNTTKFTTGYVFRKLGAGDRPGDGSTPMTSEYFLEMFRNNLIDIGLDPTPYGTHSFRHGGCQWMSVDLQWHLCDICEWGGWSTEFTHLTIVKYLIS